jgi:hypothetical protein
MNPKRSFVFPGLLIAVLMVAACSPKATAEPVTVPATSTPPATVSPTDTPKPPAVAQVPTPPSSEVEEPVAGEGELPTSPLSEVEGPVAGEGEVPTGFTDDGAPYRGMPDAAVTLVEYSDFQ